MFKMFNKRIEEPQEKKNPDGLTFDEFCEKHNDIYELAALCYHLGITPEKLKEQLKTLNEKY